VADSAPTTCNYCRAEILWLTTTNGKRMPVDARPDLERGNVLRQGDRAGVLGKSQAAAARAQGTPLRTHHALTCPYASAWSGPKGARRA
jgi:hypothetical protein